MQEFRVLFSLSLERQLREAQGFANFCSLLNPQRLAGGPGTLEMASHKRVTKWMSARPRCSPVGTCAGRSCDLGAEHTRRPSPSGGPATPGECAPAALRSGHVSSPDARRGQRASPPPLPEALPGPCRVPGRDPVSRGAVGPGSGPFPGGRRAGSRSGAAAGPGGRKRRIVRGPRPGAGSSRPPHGHKRRKQRPRSGRPAGGPALR